MQSLQEIALKPPHQEAKSLKVKSANEPDSHQARADPGFCSMEQLAVFLLPLDGVLVHYRVTPQN